LKTVIPASGPIVSGKDSLAELSCLRAIMIEIARQSSHASIIADELML
jgi:hypothetical protein